MLNNLFTTHARALIIILAVSLYCSGADTTSLAGLKDVSQLEDVVILDAGRKKPLDSYARHMLLQFSGKSTYDGQSALHWLARTIFTPSAARHYKIFMVNDMEVITAMGLSLETARRFSHSDLENGIGRLYKLAGEVNQIEQSNRTRVQNGIFRLYMNLSAWDDLTSSLHFAIPFEDFSISYPGLAQALALEGGDHSFLELYVKSEELNNFINAPASDGVGIDSAALNQALTLGRTLSQWSRHYARGPLTILPVFDTADRETWLAPWGALNEPANAENFKLELAHLGALAAHYRSGNQNGFNTAAALYKSAVDNHFKGKVDKGRIGLEVKYNKYQLFTWARVFYIMSTLVGLLAMVLWRRALYPLGIILTIGALIPHSVGILWRMMIMGRPPVTNLYETFVFVGWMSVVLGLGLEAIQKKIMGLIIAGFMGVAMLLMAQKYALEGDTMGMLVAVLDSNFWLASHVITISMGYAGCCAAAVAGHIYILQVLFSSDSSKLKDTSKAVYGILAFGFIFTFIGTVLGGIWADQSWGRFWGWDPKENGALLIVLWCSILFHARLGATIKDLGMAIGSVLCAVVVMFAWFGVNLLGVGLHSYGFSSGVGVNLLVYVIFEIAFLLISGWLIARR